MQRLGLLLAILLATSAEGAAPKITVPKKATSQTSRSASLTGASSMPPDAFIQCVQDSILGRTDGECADKGDSDACLGFQRSLEFSRLRSVCKVKKGDECEVWSHAQHTQNEWTAVASGHLAIFSSCVRSRYGTDESNGMAEAKLDLSFLELVKQIDDGSRAWGLQRGQILLKRLDGETLAHIALDAPMAKEMRPDQLYEIQEAAENPEPLRYETSAEGAAHSNPAQEGASILPQAKAYLEAAESGGSSSLGASHLQKPVDLARRPAQSIPVEAANAAVKRRPRSLYSLGLDRTLFERVNDAYERHASAMKDADDFVREIKISPVRDLSELLRRGESL